MMTSRWSILDRDICQDTRFWIQGKSTHTHTHAQGFNPQVMERVLFPFPLLQNESLILSGTHTHAFALFLFQSIFFSRPLYARREKAFLYDANNNTRASLSCFRIYLHPIKLCTAPTLSPRSACCLYS